MLISICGGGGKLIVWHLSGEAFAAATAYFLHKTPYEFHYLQVSN